MLVCVVDNRVRLRGPLPPNLVLDLQEEFQHKNPAYERAKRLDYGTGDEPPFLKTWLREGGELSFPRGGLARVRKLLERSGVPHRWRDERESGAPLPVVYELQQPLWPFQEEAVAVALSDGDGGGTTLVQAGTGGGKTQIGIAFAARVGVPTLIVVHNGALLRQWVRRACKLLGLREKDVGVVGGGKRRLRPITVALHQTLARDGAIDEEMRGYFGAVVADEVHRFAARTAYGAIDPFPARRRLGLTADHSRKDGKHPIVRDLFGPVAYDKKREELVDEGVVLDVEVRVVPTNFRAEWYRRGLERAYSGEAWRGFAEQLEDRLAEAHAVDRERNALALACVTREVGAGEQVIVLARRRHHCERLDQMLVERGVHAGYLVGGKENVRQFEETVAGLADGSRRVGVGTVEALGTGIDLPAVGVGVLATPAAGNRGLLNQIRGRVCRTSIGKTSARLYYLWDQHVNPGHLANLVKWNRTVRVLTGAGWVDGRTLLDGAMLDLSPSGISDYLNRPENTRSPRMRIKKVVSSSPEQQSAPAPQPAPPSPPPPKPPAAERTGDLFAPPQSSANLAADDSALHIALKARGYKGGLSDVRDWDGVKKFSAALWALGKLEEVPAHVASVGAPAPPPAARRPLEDDFSALQARIERKGTVLSLLTVSGWTPKARAEAARWVEGETAMPEWLTRFHSPAASAASEEADGETVSVTWGEEKITLVPNSFCMCTVGPFALSGKARPGETIEAAHARLYSELERDAERERARKIASFQAALEAAGIIHALPKKG